MKNICIVGYSGHSYVICDILNSRGFKVKYYCEKEEKVNNPFNLNYLGSEDSAECISKLNSLEYFIAIGNNKLRQKIHLGLIENTLKQPINAIHSSSVVSDSAKLGQGIMIASNVSVNAMVSIDSGVICNTGSIIEHECTIGEFAHIAPGAVLAGNVNVGKGTFVGANSVVREGITIGDNVIIGAGSVIVKDVPNSAIIYGNPGKLI